MNIQIRRVPSRTVLVLLAVVSAGLLSGACSSTSLHGIWMDESFAGKTVTHVLVLAVSPQEGARRVFEDRLSTELRAAGVAAVPGYTVFEPGDKAPAREEIEAAVKKAGADAVCVTALIGNEERQVYHPPNIDYIPVNYRSYTGAYRSHYETLYSPGYYSSHRTVSLETHLYDAASGKLMWTAQSDTGDPRSPEALSLDVARRIVRELQKQRLLPAHARNMTNRRMRL